MLSLIPPLSRALLFAVSTCAFSNASFGADAPSPFGQGISISAWRSENADAASKFADSRVTTIASTSAGGVTVGLNPATGCALWSWKWNGKEFLNQRDYGRLVQTSISVASRGSFTPNPTEAGDTYSTPYMSPSEKHGSPCVRLLTITTPTDEFSWASASSPVLSTRAVPLEWRPENLHGGRTSPMVWKALLIGKDITLNYNNMGPVAKYTTVVRVPACAGACGSFSAEIPTGYLTEEFQFQCVYDARTRECRPVSLQPTGAAIGVFPASGFGGVVFATRDQRFAMGIYGVSTQLGGSITMPGGGIILYHFGLAHDGNAPTAGNTYKWAAAGTGAFIDGDNRFNVYLVSGTVDTVKSLMSDLYDAGAK